MNSMTHMLDVELPPCGGACDVAGCPDCPAEPFLCECGAPALAGDDYCGEHLAIAIEESEAA